MWETSAQFFFLLLDACCGGEGKEGGAHCAVLPPLCQSVVSRVTIAKTCFCYYGGRKDALSVEGTGASCSGNVLAQNGELNNHKKTAEVGQHQVHPGSTSSTHARVCVNGCVRVWPFQHRELFRSAPSFSNSGAARWRATCSGWSFWVLLCKSWRYWYAITTIHSTTCRFAKVRVNTQILMQL